MAKLYWRVKDKNSGKWTWISASTEWVKDGSLITVKTRIKDMQGRYE